jgi:Domain of unknown function (DUF4926)
MKFRELETVVLERDIPEHGLRKGDLGSVVELYEPDGLDVEFVRASGKTQALVTLRINDVRGVQSRWPWPSEWGVMKGKRTKSKPDDFATGVGRAVRSAAKAKRIARMHNTPVYRWDDGKVVARKPWLSKSVHAKVSALKSQGGNWTPDTRIFSPDSEAF